jgi:CheY-like chemotaxis protein
MIVLIADDDKDDTDIFCEALKSVDPSIVCIVSHNGEEALSMLRSGLLPDFLFLDINMPRMTGKEVLRNIRSEKSFSSVRVIMHSTTFNPSEIDEYKKIGCDQFLVKSSGFEELCADLKEVLKEQRTTD